MTESYHGKQLNPHQILYKQEINPDGAEPLRFGDCYSGIAHPCPQASTSGGCWEWVLAFGLDSGKASVLSWDSDGEKQALYY